MKKNFNRVVMPEARFVAPDGSRQRVTRGSYARTLHHDHLVCTGCDAKVHFHAGAANKDGGNGRQAPHFHTNPNEKHGQSCINGKQLAERPERQHAYDETKGYRLNLDIRDISRCPDEGHRVRGFDPSRRLWVDPLYELRPIAIKSAGDFAEHLTQLDPGRLRRSVVQWHRNSIRFDRFFIRGDSRSSDLIDTLRSKSLRHPVMMYVHPQGEGWMTQTPRREDRLNYDCQAIKHPDLGDVKVRLCLEKDVSRAGIQSGVPVLALCRPNFSNGMLYIDIDQVSGVANCDLIDRLGLKAKKPAVAPPETGPAAAPRNC